MAHEGEEGRHPDGLMDRCLWQSRSVGSCGETFEIYCGNRSKMIAFRSYLSRQFWCLKEFFKLFKYNVSNVVSDFVL